MKPNELSIGDWVCAAGSVINGEERLTPPMRVVAIGETWVQLLIDPESGDPDKYDIEDILPIPLTANIVFANWSGHINIRMVESVQAEFLRYGMTYVYLAVLNHRVRIPVPYVHQLQHALRLAGIEKEIAL